MSGLFDQARARLTRSIAGKSEDDSNASVQPMSTVPTELAVPDVIGAIEGRLEDGVAVIAQAPDRVRGAARDHATSRACSILDRITNLLPTLAAAGFKLHSCDVEAGLTPTVIPRFSVTRRLSLEERENVLKANQSNRFARLILEGLMRAADLTDCLKLPGLHFAGIEVHLTTVPKVRVLFRSPGNHLQPPTPGGQPGEGAQAPLPRQQQPETKGE